MKLLLLTVFVLFNETAIQSKKSLIIMNYHLIMNCFPLSSFFFPRLCAISFSLCLVDVSRSVVGMALIRRGGKKVMVWNFSKPEQTMQYTIYTHIWTYSIL